MIEYEFAHSEFSNPPHLMDRIYKHQRFIYDASRKYYLLGRDDLISFLKPPKHSKVLELGCGTGRNLVLAAQTYPNTEFFGVDISTEMLKTAGSSIFKAYLEDRVHLAQGDATAFNSQTTFGVEGFDRIFISFSLSMIPHWHDVANHAQTLLNPGGQLHIVDFGSCERLPKSFKTLLYRWLAAFHVTPIGNMAEQLNEIAHQAGNNIEIKQLYKSYSLYCKITKNALAK